MVCFLRLFIGDQFHVNQLKKAGKKSVQKKTQKQERRIHTHTQQSDK